MKAKIFYDPSLRENEYHITNLPTDSCRGVESKSFLLFCTPKCAAQLEKHKLPAPYDQVEMKIIPTSDVYINLLDPNWTSDLCDEVAYIMEETEFLRIQAEWKTVFSFKANE